MLFWRDLSNGIGACSWFSALGSNPGPHIPGRFSVTEAHSAPFYLKKKKKKPVLSSNGIASIELRETSITLPSPDVF